jgi:antitoxin MazE
MRAKAQKWGNSLAVRIPKAIADEAGMGERDDIDIELVQGVIQIRRCRPEPTLAELLSGVTSTNLHDETDFGSPQGREAW